MTPVALRAVEDGDLPLFFAWQADEESYRMAAVPPREAEAFDAHWARLRADPEKTLRTIVADEEVAGHVSSWADEGDRIVGYWVGTPFWGQGVASEALRLFLAEDPVRPLHATVAAHNAASQRVLEKAGFELVGEEEADVRLLHFRLAAQARSSTSS